MPFALANGCKEMSKSAHPPGEMCEAIDGCLALLGRGTRHAMSGGGSSTNTKREGFGFGEGSADRQRRVLTHIVRSAPASSRNRTRRSESRPDVWCGVASSRVEDFGTHRANTTRPRTPFGPRSVCGLLGAPSGANADRKSLRVLAEETPIPCRPGVARQRSGRIPKRRGALVRKPEAAVGGLCPCVVQGRRSKACSDWSRNARTSACKDRPGGARSAVATHEAPGHRERMFDFPSACNARQGAPLQETMRPRRSRQVLWKHALNTSPSPSGSRSRARDLARQVAEIVLVLRGANGREEHAHQELAAEGERGVAQLLGMWVDGGEEREQKEEVVGQEEKDEEERRRDPQPAARRVRGRLAQEGQDPPASSSEDC